jgi:hypothetical protein
MPRFATGTVTRILSEREGLQRVEVDGRPAYVLTRLIGPVSLGDRVVVNTTAVDLGLGTGGWDVVHWNLARDAWGEPGRGHIMKLRYTSLQLDTGSTEELASFDARLDLRGAPVVACGLHSQVACVAAAFKYRAPDRRLTYVMTDAGALPAALSDLVADLRAADLVDATVTCGHAFGGDHEAVNLYSGLEVALAATGADAAVVGMGPGSVGTGTSTGFSGIEVAQIVDAASALDGRPIVAVRYSDGDARERHRGVSHHTVAALRLAHARTVVALPRDESAEAMDAASGHPVLHVNVPDMEELLSTHGLRVTTMGRGPAEDPGFFRYAGAAGVAAAQLLPRPER